ncbi:hypothetical protein [Thermaurantiacus sp.]
MEPVAFPPAAAPREVEARRVGEAFEALVIERLLKAARPEATGLAGGGGLWSDLVDRARAELIAKGSPLGVARLVAEAARPEKPGE